jgi:hypothetical protein
MEVIRITYCVGNIVTGGELPTNDPAQTHQQAALFGQPSPSGLRRSSFFLTPSPKHDSTPAPQAESPQTKAIEQMQKQKEMMSKLMMQQQQQQQQQMHMYHTNTSSPRTHDYSPTNSVVLQSPPRKTSRYVPKLVAKYQLVLIT